MNQIFLNGITINELAEALIPLLASREIIAEPTQTVIPEGGLLNREEVCKMLSINKTTLWKYTKLGKLKSYGIGNRVLYKRNEVLECLTLLKK
jgi:predicted DNA-binding transcriptional regulator AlpA